LSGPAQTQQLANVSGICGHEVTRSLVRERATVLCTCFQRKWGGGALHHPAHRVIPIVYYLFMRQGLNCELYERRWSLLHPAILIQACGGTCGCLDLRVEQPAIKSITL